MRCTKCHYLSFEPEPRCRNCGHDLSLEEGSAFDLAHGESESMGAAESGGYATAVMAPPKVASSAHSSRIPTKDLPLFVQSMQSVSDQLAAGDDPEPVHEPEHLEPLVKVPARPRTPVSVRRATPDPAKLRAKYGMSSSMEPDLWSNIPAEPIDSVDLHGEPEAFHDLPLTAEQADQWTNETTDRAQQWTSGPRDQGASAEQWTNEAVDSPPWANGREEQWANERADDRTPIGWVEPVSAGARLAAALIDAMFLGAVSAVVIYLTLQVSGLSISQIGLLPILPLSALLVMLIAGYFLLFKMASGETLGNMAMRR
jgi:hypothetical protein